MANERELEEKFWSAVKSDRTMMLGLAGEHRHARPMTAQLDGERGPIWFFASRDNALVQEIAAGHEAVATFSSKGHDLFAEVHGELSIDNDRAQIDRLWNRFVAAWFDGGKDDPKLVLLRFDARHAEIWMDASSLLAGIKMLFGVDPKQDYKDKAGAVDLRA